MRTYQIVGAILLPCGIIALEYVCSSDDDKHQQNSGDFEQKSSDSFSPVKKETVGKKYEKKAVYSTYGSLSERLNDNRWSSDLEEYIVERRQDPEVA